MPAAPTTLQAVASFQASCPPPRVRGYRQQPCASPQLIQRLRATVSSAFILKPRQEASYSHEALGAWGGGAPCQGVSGQDTSGGSTWRPRWQVQPRPKTLDPKGVWPPVCQPPMTGFQVQPRLVESLQAGPSLPWASVSLSVLRSPGLGGLKAPSSSGIPGSRGVLGPHADPKAPGWPGEPRVGQGRSRPPEEGTGQPSGPPSQPCPPLPRGSRTVPGVGT